MASSSPAPPSAAVVPSPPLATPGTVRSSLVAGSTTTVANKLQPASASSTNKTTSSLPNNAPVASCVSRVSSAAATTSFPIANAKKTVLGTSVRMIARASRAAVAVPSPNHKDGVTVRKLAVATKTTERRALERSNVQHVKKATSLQVPKTVLSTEAKEARYQQPSHPAASPVSYFGSPTTDKVSVHLSNAMGRQRGMNKYHQKQADHATASKLATMEQGVGGALSASSASKPGASYRSVVVPRKKLPASNIAKHPIISSASTSPPSLVAAAAAAEEGAPAMPPLAASDRIISIGGSPSLGGTHLPSKNSLGGTHLSSKKRNGHALRRGKWTAEEESYASRLINEFKSGLLPLTDGTTLRNFLSKLLNCDPMRISKKFVGNNCIGKQVFRRRVADINRLAPEKIQQMRMELGELERRFFNRVAQTNRVKSPGVASIMAAGVMVGVPASTSININNVNAGKAQEEMDLERPPTPPWLRPPSTYQPKGIFANKPKRISNEASPAMSLPAPSAAPKLLPEVHVSSKPLSDSSTPPAVLAIPPLTHANPTTEKMIATIKRSGSSLDCLALAAAAANEEHLTDGSELRRTESALEQLARTASAAKFVEDIVNGDSSLGDTEKDDGKKLSQTKLQGSFEALMSMDIHSVGNLVDLASSTHLSTAHEVSSKSSSPEMDMKNDQSCANLSFRMESFIKSLSSANLLKSGSDSQAALGSLLNVNSSSNFFNSAEKIKKFESATGFSQLRADDGLGTGSHSSIDDFLSLVASGDIPHQDPNLLNVPLQKVMQQNGIPPKGTEAKTLSKRKFSQQQLVALASRLAGTSTNLSDMMCGPPVSKKKRKK